VLSSIFSQNSGYNGGAIYSVALANELRKSDFESNSATYGGAVHFVYGTAKVEQSSFNLNSASQQGGGVYTSSLETFFTGSRFTSNSAPTGKDVMLDSETLGTVPDAIYFTACEIQSVYSSLGGASLTDSTATTVIASSGSVVSLRSDIGLLDSTNSDIELELSTVDNLDLKSSSLSYKTSKIDTLQVKSASSVLGETSSRIDKLQWTDGTIDGENIIISDISVFGSTTRILEDSGILAFQSTIAANISASGITVVDGEIAATGCWNGGTIRLDSGPVALASSCNNLATTDVINNAILILPNGLTVKSLTSGPDSVIEYSILLTITILEGGSLRGVTLEHSQVFGDGAEYVVVSYNGTLDTTDLDYSISPSVSGLTHKLEVLSDEIIITFSSSAAGLLTSVVLLLIALTI